MLEMFTPEVITSLGSAGAATLLSVYFIYVFTRFQRDSIDKIIDDNKEERKALIHEMKEDRRIFQEAVNKLDARLHYIEKVLEKER